MKLIEPRVSEEAAWKFFQRPRFGNCWGLLRSSRRHSHAAAENRSARQLPYVELLWMPHYLINFQVESAIGLGEISVSVESHSGAFAIFQMHQNLVEQNPADGESFRPKLSETEAIRIGRQELITSILRRRGNREKPFVRESRSIEVFHYPFWVYYFSRRREVLDFLVCDAARGGKGGARTKVGILSCLVESDARRVTTKGTPAG